MKFLDIVKKYWQLFVGFLLAVVIALTFKRKKSEPSIKETTKPIHNEIKTIEKEVKQIEKEKAKASDNVAVIEKKIEAVEKQVNNIKVEDKIALDKKIEYLKRVSRAKKG